MLCFLVLFASAAVIARVAAGPSAVGGQPAAGEYLVETDPAPEPSGDVAVYRVRVRAVGSRGVRLDLDGGQISQGAVSRAEPVGEVHTTDVEITVILRPAELECRVKNGAGGINFTDAVAPGTRLAAVVEVPAGTRATKLGRPCLVARLNGKAVEVWVDAPPG